MNYFSKNLKTLRARSGLSQEQFARVFGLSKSNVNSYEMGAFPKLEKFIQIMDHFGLDPSKFMKLDMEQHSVDRNATTTREEADAAELSMELDTWVERGVPEHLQYQYLDSLSPKELQDLYVKQCHIRDRILKENLELKAKYIKLLEERAR